MNRTQKRQFNDMLQKVKSQTTMRKMENIKRYKKVTENIENSEWLKNEMAEIKRKNYEYIEKIRNGEI